MKAFVKVKYPPISPLKTKDGIRIVINETKLLEQVYLYWESNNIKHKVW